MRTNPERTVPSPLAKPTISVVEAGRLLGLGKDGAYEAVRRGDIPCIRLGRTIRVPTALLLEKLGIDPSSVPAPVKKTVRKKVA